MLNLTLLNFWILSKMKNMAENEIVLLDPYSDSLCTGRGVLFSSQCPFLHLESEILGHFVTNFRTFGSFLKAIEVWRCTNIRYG